MESSLRFSFYLMTAVFIGIPPADLLSVGHVRTHFRKAIHFPSNQTISVSQEEVSEFEIEESIIDVAGNDLLSSDLPIFEENFSDEISLSEISELQSESSVTVWDCGSPGAQIANSSINGCTGDPCVVRHGSVITLNVTFMARRPSTNLWCGIDVSKGMIHKHYKCPQDDLCTGSRVCPLQPGRIYSIWVKKPLSAKIPKWQWLVVGKLRDNYGDMLCIAAHVKVV